MALGRTWQALMEGKGLPEQGGRGSQVVGLEIPQPSPELGFTPTAPLGSAGAGGTSVPRKHPGAQLAGEQGRSWLDRPPPIPTAPRARHPPLLPSRDIREERRPAEGERRHGGGCRQGSARAGAPSCGVTQEAHPRAGGTMGLLRCLTGRQLLAGHCLCSPPPDGDLPTGARTSRAPRAGGIGCPQLRAAFHLLPGRGSLSVTCCPPGRRPREPRAGLVCETWPLCPHVLGQGRLGQMPRKHHPTPRTPCTQTHRPPRPPAPSCRSVAQGGLGRMEPGKAPLQRQQLCAPPLPSFPLPLAPAVSGESRSRGAGGGCACGLAGRGRCGDTRGQQRVHVSTRVCAQDRVRLWVH